MTPGSSGNYSLNSGAQITLSGSNPSLQIAGNVYHVINSLGSAGSTTGTDLQGMALGGNFYALGMDINASSTSSTPRRLRSSISNSWRRSPNSNLASLHNRSHSSRHSIRPRCSGQPPSSQTRNP